MKTTPFKQDELRLELIFPNASKDFIKVNAKNTKPHPELECSKKNAPLCVSQVEQRGTGKVFICLTSIRKRLIDTDNLCTKAIVDICRHSGIIHDDTAKEAQVCVRQRKPEKGEEEGTVIEIYTEEK